MKTQRSLKANGGFTVLELFVVIAIIGIMAAVAIPNLLKYLPRSRLSGAARTVAGDLMAARMAAVKRNCIVRVAFETASVYYIHVDENCNKVVDVGETKILKDLSKEYSDVVNIKEDTYNIFNSRGATSRQRNIILKNASGEKTIRVSIAGRVKIE